MILTEEFFNQLSSQLEQNLPFVAYKKPENENIIAFLQRDEQLYKAKNFEESGFIFAPFDDRLKTAIIPQSQSQIISTLFNKEDLQTSGFKEKLIEEKSCKEEHLELIQKGIEEIAKGELKKVVLSRTEELFFEEPLKDSAVEVFKRLLLKYPEAFGYLWFHPQIGLWLGATPETLLKTERNRFETMALAGTRKNEDKNEIPWGEKEKEEQELVIHFLYNNLSELDFLSDIEQSDTHTSKAGNLLHLRTKITGKIDANHSSKSDSEESNSNLEKLIKTIHPTPAVCGLPREKAREFILENEHYRREYYTGYLGELNFKKERSRNKNRKNQENSAYKSVSKSSALFVNLRCMKFEDKKAQLFVGGGITASSNPEDEWEETRNKAETMKSILVK